MKSPKHHIIKVGLLTLLATGVAAYGNSCGQFDSKNAGLDSSDALCTEKNVEFNIVEGTETASISYGRQVLDNMIACTGLNNISQKTLDAYSSRQASLSEYGSVLDINPPLVMAHTALAVEVCDDLYSEEMALAQNQRRIFASVNESTQGMDDQEISETLRRMSRACWGRDETPEELNILTEELWSIVNNLNDASEAQKFSAISICTSVLASLEGYRM